jgi:hypothetical protein
MNKNIANRKTLKRKTKVMTIKQIRKDVKRKIKYRR